MDRCSFDGCDKKVKANGLCNAHNLQRLNGETLRPLQVQFHGLTEEARFLKRVNVKTKDECWEWVGSQKAGWHGQWRNAAGKIELTHRASWRLFKSEIPGGLFVLHKCDNPLCVNPNHLFLGTQSDNLRDMWNKGRAHPGVSRGEKHGMSKLTAEAVADIRSSQLSGVELAKLYGVTTTTICDVRKRRIWKHV